MILTQAPFRRRGRIPPWTLPALALAAAVSGAYALVDLLDAIDPLAQGRSAPAAPFAAPAPLQRTSLLAAAVGPLGLTAQDAEAAERAALPADQPPTF